MNFIETLLNIAKMMVDFIVAITLLVLLAPVALFLCIAIKLTDNGPLIFSQKRIGKSGKSFTLYKFRSMHPGKEDGFHLLTGKDDRRITVAGRFMRKHRFDEIPNFINVIKGEMSLIGPRPEQEHFIEQIIQRAPQYSRLQTVKPGITSWGQVKFGYASNVDGMLKRMEYDLYYLDNRSIWFDLKIAFYTIGIIIKGHGM